MINGRVVVCGGSPGFNLASRECYTYDSRRNDWIKLLDMKNARQLARSTVTPDGRFWMTGGARPAT